MTGQWGLVIHRFIGGTLVDRYGSATVLFLLTAACLPLQDYALSHTHRIEARD